MPPITYRTYVVSGNHIHWPPLPHPHKSNKPIALEAWMISCYHGWHLTAFVFYGRRVPLPLNAKHIQQPLGKLHNVLANPIQNLSASMDYPYFWALIHCPLFLFCKDKSGRMYSQPPCDCQLVSVCSSTTFPVHLHWMQKIRLDRVKLLLISVLSFFLFLFSLFLFSFFLSPHEITSFHGHFQFCACTHDTLNSAVEVVPLLLWTSSFDSSSQKEKYFLQLRQLFCYSFNDSDHHSTNSSSGDFDSALSIFLPFFFFFLLSLFAHLYGISATRRHLRHFFGSLYLPFVSDWHQACATASALWQFCQAL